MEDLLKSQGRSFRDQRRAFQTGEFHDVGHVRLEVFDDSGKACERRSLALRRIGMPRLGTNFMACSAGENRGSRSRRRRSAFRTKAFDFRISRAKLRNGPPIRSKGSHCWRCSRQRPRRGRQPQADALGARGQRRDAHWQVEVGEWYPRDWELYDLDANRTELNDLAAKQPQRVQEMAKQYDAWAQCGILDTEGRSLP
jgi:hypothetical protein